jgi:hypothetical protein
LFDLAVESKNEIVKDLTKYVNLNQKDRVALRKALSLDPYDLLEK